MLSPCNPGNANRSTREAPTRPSSLEIVAAACKPPLVLARDVLVCAALHLQATSHYSDLSAEEEARSSDGTVGNVIRASSNASTRYVSRVECGPEGRPTS